MESVKIKVSHRNGETIVKSDKGAEFKFGGKMLSETVIASLVFQTVYMNFEKLRNVSENFEISLTMDYTVHQDETQADNETTKILQVKSQNQKNVILKILEDDNPTTYHTYEDYDNENILVDGNISFDAMAEIVDYLREQNNKLNELNEL